MAGRILPLAELVPLMEEWKKEGKTIVTTNGAFDLLHKGHLFLLEECRKEGDVLIVGINSNASVKRYKGQDRPIEDENIRARNVSQYADAVFVFEEDDPREWLKRIRPSVHCNAATYGEHCVEAPVLREIGARLHLIPVKKEFGSTTERIKKGTPP